MNFIRFVWPLLAVLFVSAGVNSQTSGTALRIKTDVSGVDVLIDGEIAGRTPLTLQSLNPGKIKLTFVKPGFEDETREVEVIASKTASVFVVMKKILTPIPELPQSFLGVHEHVAGRCSGRLTIYLDHLEYKADKGPDSFSIPLSAVTFLSRSTGPLFVVPAVASTVGGVLVGVAGIERRNPAGVLPVRVETKERKYGFWVYEETGEAMLHTTFLYQLISRLMIELPPPVKK